MAARLRLGRRIAMAGLFVMLASSCRDGGGAISPDGSFPRQLTAAADTVQEGSAGGNASVLPAVVVMDERGQPLAGIRVRFSVLSGGGELTGQSQTTRSDGRAAVTGWTLGRASGDNVVVASVGGLPAVQFRARAMPGPPDRLEKVSGDLQAAPAATSLPEPLVVRVLDRFGNAVGADKPVSFTVETGGGTVDPAVAQTDSAGWARTSLTTGPIAASNVVVASLPGTSATARFTAMGLAGPPAAMAIVSGNDQAGEVGRALPAPVVVRVTDINGNAVGAGIVVRFEATSGGGLLEPDSTVTDASGLARATWRLGPMLGENTGRAWVSGGPATAALPLRARATSGPPTRLAIFSGNAQVDSVGRTLPLPLVVQLTDAYDNPVVAGHEVLFHEAAGGGVANPRRAVTDSSGRAQTVWTLGPTAGTQQVIVALSASPSLTVTFSATALAGGPAAIAIVSGNAQTDTVGQTLPQPLVVQVTDAFGNPVAAGTTVNFVVPVGGGTVSPAAVATDASGRAQTNWTLGTTAGAQSVTASLPAVPAASVSFSATAVPDGPAAMVIVSGNAQTDTVGQALPAPIVVEVRDSYGNPVTAGTSVNFVVTSGGGSVSPGAVSTAATGRAQTTWTLGTVPGANGVTASVPAVPAATVSFSATAVAGAPASLVIVSGNTQTDTVGQALPAPLVVEVRDTYGNTVAAGNTVNFAVTSGGGSASPAAPVTDAAGRAQTTWTLGTVPGANGATASLPAVPAATVSFSATAVAGAPASLVIVSGNTQTDTVGQALPAPLIVEVRDTYGNTVAAGNTVNFAVTSGGGSVSPASPATNASGQTQTSWTLGTTAGAQSVTASLPAVPAATVTFNATAVPDGPAAMVIVSGNAQTDTVGQALPAPIVVEVRDSYGNPVTAGTSVNFAVTSGGGSVSPGAVSTDAAGRAQTTWTLGTVPGANGVTASVPAVPAATVSFTATAVADAPASITLISGDAQTDTVGQALPAPLVVEVRDTYGNTVAAGNTVNFAITGGGGSASPASPVTDAAGRAQTTWTLGTVPGANGATASLPAVPTASVNFTATAVAGAPASLVIVSGNTQTDTVGQALPAPLVVEVRDTYGNTVAAGNTVNFAVASGGGSVSPASPATNASGQTQTSWTLGTTAGAQSVTASLPAVPAASVTFSATAVPDGPAAMVIVSGNAQTDTVGQALPAPIVVEVRDSYGNPVTAGTSVSFVVTSGGGSVSPGAVSTDASGRAQTTWTLGTVPGANGVTASVPAVPAATVNFTATAVPDAPASIALISGDAQTDTVGQALPAPLVVEVRDTYGNTVAAGNTVNFAITGGGGSVSPASPVTDAAGRAQTTWTLGTVPGANGATASLPAVPAASVNFTATAVAGAPASLVIVSGNAQTDTVGHALAQPLVVEVRDTYGNAVAAGNTVNFAVTSGGGSVSPASPTTNASGQTQTNWTLGTTAGAQSVTASLPAVPAATVSFSATAVPDAPAAMVMVSGDAQTDTVGQALPAPIVVEVRDSYGNPVLAGISVNFAVTSGGGSVSPGAVSTAANGRAQTTWTLGTVPGANGVTASVPAVPAATVSFTATAVPDAPASITLISGDAQTDTVGQALPQPLVVEVRDTYGNTVAAGNTVNFAITSGGGSASPAAPATDAAGRAQTTWTLGTVPGANGATASLPAVPAATVSFTATAVAGAPASLVIVSGNAQTDTVGHALAQPLVVEVRDTYGNPVAAGNTVNFAVTSGGGSVSPASPTTNASGQTQTDWTLGTTAGAQSVTASLPAVPAATVTFNATAVPDGPAAMVIVSGNAQTDTVGQALPAPIVVEVRDSYGNPVSAGTSVDFTVTSGGGSVSPGAVSTDASGRAQTTWTLGTTPGANGVTASAPAVPAATVNFTATAVPDAPASIALISGDAQTDTVGQALPQPLVVEVRDTYGNTVAAGNTVNFAVTSGGGSASPAAPVTDAAGRAQTTWTLGTVPGANGATASLPAVPAATVSFTATAVAGAPSSLVIVSGNAQTDTVGQALAQPLVVEARDTYGNPVAAGNTVNFAVTSGGGSVSPSSPTTNASGRTQTSWTLGTTAGAQSVSASLPAVPAATVTFSATAVPDAPAAMVMVSGDAQTDTVGQALPQPLVVEVRDGFGNPVIAGVAVNFAVTSGGGSVTPAATSTNAAGRAQTAWTLGTVPGANGVTASVPSVPAATVNFTATAVAGAPSAIVIVSGNAQTDTAGQTLPQPLVVEVRDTYGNAVAAGNGVTFTPNASGGSVSPASTTTNASGRAQTSWTLGIYAGTDSVTASPTAAPAATVVFTATVVSPAFSLMVGGTHTCGLATGVYCWGINTSGELGDGTTTSRTTATAAATNLVFVEVTTGLNHSCGLTAAGAAYCWGNNGSGRLGDGTTTNRTTPTAVSGGLTFATISAGDAHTCAVTTAGAAYCWGNNGTSRLGDGTTTNRTTPTAVSGGLVYSRISAGAAHTCAITTAGAGYCWGSNGSGRLGDGTTTNRTTPTAVTGGLTYARISAGNSHTCATTTTDSYCWGNNGNGRLGDGTTTNRTAPTAVSGGFTFTRISAGASHSCAITGAGAAYCWGLNTNGRLGDNSTTQRTAPTAVSGGHTFTGIAAANAHSCGTTASTAYCWGLNTNGRLGDGTTTQRLVPTAVIQP